MPAPPLSLFRAAGSMILRSFISAAVLAASAACGIAQMPMPRTVPAGPLSGPILYIRVAGPPGMGLHFVPRGRPRNFPSPATIGVRPGYIYQFAITDLPRRQDLPDAPQTLFPTIEVRGALATCSSLNAATHPAPLVFTPDDIAQAQAGAMVTKIVVLENPDHAVAEATTLDHPLEFDVPVTQNAFEEARLRGRPLAIVRLGAREVGDDELAARQVPGTILFPGEHVLPPAASPPVLPSPNWPPYDPILGPRAPAECICDGGDRLYRASNAPNGRLYGLDPQDTVAQYVDSCGNRHIACSNPVCVFAPRYVVLRCMLYPLGYTGSAGLSGVVTATPEYLLAARKVPVVNEQEVQVEALHAQKKLTVAQVTVGTVEVEQLCGLAEVSAKVGGAVVTAVCAKKPCPPPNRPLCLVKTVDRTTAQVGDVVNFTLKYTNTGGQPMTEVAISDSLTTRLEYVTGSAKSDREAAFTTVMNEAGSLVLRWQLSGSLPPGQSGILTFQAKVR
jgi:uncharacterized repeat protein (TIGR01451 family)